MRWASLGLLVFVFSPMCWGVTPNTIIVKDLASPIEIQAYSAAFEYGSSSQYSRVEKGIHHKLNFINRTELRVVAIRFRFVSFNVFDEYIGQLGGYDLDVHVPASGKQRTTHDTASWVQRHYGDFAFMTGVVYVDKVRFADGRVWKVDRGYVLKELRKIEADFDATRLDEESVREE